MNDKKPGNELLLGGKSAIVTGGTRGIGRAIAWDLACNGANVAINYRRSSDEADAFVQDAFGAVHRAHAQVLALEAHR